MTFSILRRFCVVTTFAAVCCVLSSAVLADLTTARIALQTRQFELALDQAKDLATTYPFDSAMIAARTHVELGQLHQALRAAKRASIGTKAGGTPDLKGHRAASPGQTAPRHVSSAARPGP